MVERTEAALGVIPAPLAAGADILVAPLRRDLVARLRRDLVAPLGRARPGPTTGFVTTGVVVASRRCHSANRSFAAACRRSRPFHRA